jgi:hypothetical protein
MSLPGQEAQDRFASLAGNMLVGPVLHPQLHNLCEVIVNCRINRSRACLVCLIGVRPVRQKDRGKLLVVPLGRQVQGRLSMVVCRIGASVRKKDHGNLPPVPQGRRVQGRISIRGADVGIHSGLLEEERRQLHIVLVRRRMQSRHAPPLRRRPIILRRGAHARLQQFLDDVDVEAPRLVLSFGAHRADCARPQSTRGSSGPRWSRCLARFSGWAGMRTENSQQVSCSMRCLLHRASVAWLRIQDGRWPEEATVPSEPSP